MTSPAAAGLLLCLFKRWLSPSEMKAPQLEPKSLAVTARSNCRSVPQKNLSTPTNNVHPAAKQLDDQVPPVPLPSSLTEDSTGFRQLKFRHIVDDNTDSVPKGSQNCHGNHMPGTDLADLPSSGQKANQQTLLLTAVSTQCSHHLQRWALGPKTSTCIDEATPL